MMGCLTDKKSNYFQELRKMIRKRETKEKGKKRKKEVGRGQRERVLERVKYRVR